jgi:hypothetical protein
LVQQQKNTFVRTYIDAQNYNAWIGYTDATTEGSFVWTNGEPNVYTNWETGSPSTGANTDDAVRLEEDGEWDDRPLTNTERYILELDCTPFTVTPVLTAGLTSGSNFPIGTTTVTYTAADAVGNTSTCSFTVTVNDTANPTITCGPNVTATTGAGSCTAAVTLTAPMNINSITSSCFALPAAGACSGGNGAATTGITINAGQTFWYSSTGTFANITLNGGTLRICGNLTLTNINFTSGTIAIEQGGTLTINGSGTLNLNGNSSIINRGTLNINRSVTLQNANNLIGNAIPSAVINMNGGSYTLTLNSATSRFVNFGSSNIRSIVIQGATNGVVCLGYGSTSEFGTVTNNTANSVNAPDGIACFKINTSATLNSALTNTANVNVCQAPAATFTGSYGSATVNTNCTACTSVPVYSDNCGIASITNSFNGTGNASGNYPVGTTTVIWTVTDVNGNTATCSQTVTVTDLIAPTITCPATQTLTLGSSCTATLPNYTSLAIAADNCGTPTITQSPAAGTTVSLVGAMTVTLTATDAAGNISTCNFTVNKVDTSAPSITCPSNITTTATPGLCGAAV